MVISTMVNAFRILVAFAALAAGISAQEPDTLEQAQRSAAARITRQTHLLDWEVWSHLADDKWEEQRASATEAIRAEVTSFIESSISLSASQAAIQASLRAVLAAHRPGMGDDELPMARVAPLRYGRSLVASYTVVRPPHNDSSLIYGFIQDGPRFRRVAVTGEAFEHHSLVTTELPSPVMGEMWLLVAGRRQRFNGSLSRFEVYAFDGDAFRTVWTKERVLSATVKMLANGFSITHLLRPEWRDVTDEYVLTPGGVLQVK